VIERDLDESIEQSHPIVPEETEREARSCDIGQSRSKLHARQMGLTSSSVKGDGISLASSRAPSDATRPRIMTGWG
jgi:hypothetical protein